MNQEDTNIFTRRIVEYLNQSANRIKPSTLSRLQSMRETAVSKLATKTTSKLAGAGLSEVQFEFGFDYRLWVSLGAFIFCLISLNYYHNNQLVSESEEIDAALLTSELPINAYLDQDFDAWLEHSSSE